MKKLLLLTAIIAGTSFFMTAAAQYGYGYQRDYSYGHDNFWKRHHKQRFDDRFDRDHRYNESRRDDHRFDNRSGYGNQGSYGQGKGQGGYTNPGNQYPANGGSKGGYNNPGNGSSYPGSGSTQNGAGSHNGSGQQGGGRQSSHRN
jgi:hypothetical protein